MKRIQIIGLSLATVFAVYSVAVASASAVAPEFVVPGGFPKAFNATGGAGKLVTKGGRTVECSSGSGTGTVAGEKETTKTKVAFKGCKGTGPFGIKVACKSAGAAAEEIVTNALIGKLRYLNKGKKEVGVVLEPEAGSATLFAKFECGGVQELKVRGTAIGQITTLNKKQAVQELNFEQAGGVQKWLEYEEANGTKVKPALNETEGVKTGFGGENFAFEQSAVEGTSKQELTTKEAWEVKG